MKEIIVDSSLVAACGLYCGACGQYRRGKCPGCAKNDKASWCSIRSCNREHSLRSCSECTSFSNVNQCKKFNNPISKIFGFVFRSNRKACIERIKTLGYDSFAAEMAAAGRQSMPR